jgi:uncharacterized protein
MGILLFDASSTEVIRSEVPFAPGMTVQDALRSAGLSRHLANASLKLAVFGRLARPSDLLADGERIEILRALVADPNEARLRRAAKKRAKRRA